MGVNGLGIRLLGNYTEYQGYDGVFTQNSYSFDNSYFEQLTGLGWLSAVDSNGDSYWRENGGTGSMLNNDITIGWDIDDLFNSTTNEYECIVNKASVSSSSKPACSRRTSSKDVIDSYVSSDQVLLNVFKTSWIKLITIGYDETDLTIDDLATEPPETTDADAAYRTGILYHTIVSIFIVVTTIYCAINDEY